MLSSNLPPVDQSRFRLAVSRLDEMLARFVPEEVRHDSDMARRARLVVYFSLVIALCGPAYGTVYLLLGMDVSAVGAGVAALFLPMTPWLLKRTKDVALAGHWVTAGSYLALVLVTVRTGALSAPAVTWFALLPVTALMLTGRYGGLVWSIISCGTVVAYWGVELAQVTPVTEVPAAYVHILRMVVAVGLIGIIAWLAMLYEVHKDRMLRQIEEARDSADVAHRDARLVLDHVSDGLLTVDLKGRLVGTRSKAADEMFDVSKAVYLWDLFAETNSELAQWLELCWEDIENRILPIDLHLQQFPSSATIGERVITLKYVPIQKDRELTQIMMIAIDETEQARQRAIEARKEEQLEAVHWVIKDPEFFHGFVEETRALVTRCLEPKTVFVQVMRDIHTLKGNVGLFGFRRFASYCHSVESEVRDAHAQELSTEAKAGLQQCLEDMLEIVTPLQNKTDHELVDFVVGQDDYRGLVAALEAGVSPREILSRVRRWTWPVSTLYARRLVEQAKALAKRLGRAEPTFLVNIHADRLPPRDWSDFWSSMIHVVRNALDHGIEDSEIRVAQGKPAAGTLALTITEDQDELEIRFTDDGRGIEWKRLEERAQELGLSIDKPEEVIFLDGLSTATDVTDISGRGVGMSAVRQSCETLGGRVMIDSRLGEGTAIAFRFPLDGGMRYPEPVATGSTRIPSVRL